MGQTTCVYKKEEKQDIDSLLNPNQKQPEHKEFFNSYIKKKRIGSKVATLVDHELSVIKKPSSTGFTNLLSKHFDLLPPEDRYNQGDFNYSTKNQQCLNCDVYNCKKESWLQKKNVFIAGLSSTLFCSNIIASQRPSTHLINSYKLVEQFKVYKVKTIINLQREHEHPKCCPNMSSLESTGFSYNFEEFENEGIKVKNYGWRVQGMNPFEWIVMVVKKIIKVVYQNKNKVFIHCHSGLGRTCLIIACYIIFSRKIDNIPVNVDSIINELKEARPGCFTKLEHIEVCKKFEFYISSAMISFVDSRVSIEKILKRQEILLFGDDVQLYSKVPKALDLFLSAFVTHKELHKIPLPTFLSMLTEDIEREWKQDFEPKLESLKNRLNQGNFNELFKYEFETIVMTFFDWLEDCVEYLLDIRRIRLLNSGLVEAIEHIVETYLNFASSSFNLSDIDKYYKNKELNHELLSDNQVLEILGKIREVLLLAEVEILFCVALFLCNVLDSRHIPEENLFIDSLLVKMTFYKDEKRQSNFNFAELNRTKAFNKQESAFPKQQQEENTTKKPGSIVTGKSIKTLRNILRFYMFVILNIKEIVLFFNIEISDISQFLEKKICLEGESKTKNDQTNLDKIKENANEAIDNLISSNSNCVDSNVKFAFIKHLNEVLNKFGSKGEVNTNSDKVSHKLLKGSESPQVVPEIAGLFNSQDAKEHIKISNNVSQRLNTNKTYMVSAKKFFKSAKSNFEDIQANLLNSKNNIRHGLNFVSDKTSVDDTFEYIKTFLHQCHEKFFVSEGSTAKENERKPRNHLKEGLTIVTKNDDLNFESRNSLGSVNNNIVVPLGTPFTTKANPKAIKFLNQRHKDNFLEQTCIEKPRESRKNISPENEENVSQKRKPSKTNEKDDIPPRIKFLSTDLSKQSSTENIIKLKDSPKRKIFISSIINNQVMRANESKELKSISPLKLKLTKTPSHLFKSVKVNNRKQLKEAFSGDLKKNIAKHYNSDLESALDNIDNRKDVNQYSDF